jgi:tRNA threonylcarbamoyladenosine biosynthesis protein TsaE
VTVAGAATFRTSSPDESLALGRALGELLEPGAFIALTGELGAGKTVLVQGIARGLGFDGYVSSPSFVIMNEYAGRLAIHHVDLYRISAPGDLCDLGYREVFWSDGVTLVEWAERVIELLPDARLDLAIEIAEPGARVIRAVAHGEGARATLASLTSAWSRRSCDADPDH